MNSAVLTNTQMREQAEQNDNYVEGVVSVALGDLVGVDFEDFLDIIATLLTGSDLLMNISYSIVGCDVDKQVIHLQVTGDASQVLELNGDDE